METSTLRWILIIIGLAIIAAVWLFSTMERNRKPKATRRQQEKRRKSDAAKERREPTLGAAGSGGAAPADEAPSGQGELEIDERPQPQRAPPREPPRAPLGPPPDKIVSLFLLARNGVRIANGAAGAIQSGDLLPDPGDRFDAAEVQETAGGASMTLSKPMSAAGWDESIQIMSSEREERTMIISLCVAGRSSRRFCQPASSCKRTV